MRNLFKSHRLLGILLAIVLVLGISGAVYAAVVLALSTQHVSQVITSPGGSETIPAGMIEASTIDLPSLQTGTEFQYHHVPPVTVTTNTPGSVLKVTVDPGNYVEFGVKLTCTSNNASSISGEYWNNNSMEVSTYQDTFGYFITLGTAGTYTFSEEIVGYTGAVGTGSGDIQFELTFP